MATNQLQKLNPKHEAILADLVSQPGIKRGELARKHGVTPAWLSVITNSDAFQAELRNRQAEVFGEVTAGLADKAAMVAHAALDRLSEQLPLAQDPETVLEIAERMLDRAGVGVKATNPLIALQQNNTITVSQNALTRARSRLIGNQPNEATEQVSPAALSHEGGVGDAPTGLRGEVAEEATWAEGAGAEV